MSQLTSLHSHISTRCCINIHSLGSAVARLVFVHCDTHCTPLQHPYEGPYKVLQPHLKTFKIDREGRPDTIQSKDLSQCTWTWNIPLSSPKCLDVDDDSLGPLKLFLQIQPNPTTLISPTHHVSFALIQGVTLSFHKIASRFWGERCGRKGLWTTRKY